MRSLFIPLQLATNARGLEFITNLDPTIDQVARTALLEAEGNGKDAVLRQLSELPDEAGIVVGDETRLRQIITNLARCANRYSRRKVVLTVFVSNACKFTPTGGKLIIATKLVIPSQSRLQSFYSRGSKEGHDLPSPSSPGNEMGIMEITRPAENGEFEVGEHANGLLNLRNQK